jgi:RNA polymerase-binding transcription factor DksA
VQATTAARLIRLRQELQQRLDRIEKDLQRGNEPLTPDAPDRAIQVQNDEVLTALAQSTRSELAQVDRAVERHAAGLQADCETCGQPISAERLEAIPYATRCARCVQ